MTIRLLRYATCAGLVGIGLLLTSTLGPAAPTVQAQGGYSLRFYGNGVDAPDEDRVKIKIDDPARPADIGATDFTLEFWMKAGSADNDAGAITCGANVNWIYGNIIFDRDRYNQGRKYGLSLGNGRLVFGVTGTSSELTICGTSSVLNNQWHHVAVQRRLSDGMMWLYVDGQLQASGDGPNGDVSYPDGAPPGNFCGGPCVNDRYLVIAAEKHDAGSEYPSYSGFVDEVRLSTMLRYSGNFTPPSAAFTTDANTAALYHFDEGPAGACTGSVLDSSGASGGPSNGTCNYGGSPAGPVYSTDTPFGGTPPTPTRTPTRTPTPQPPQLVGTPSAAPLASAAVIRWQTNQAADSRVRYGTTCSPWTTVTDSALTTDHSLALAGLDADTQYCYQVYSANSGGNTGWSASQMLTTLVSEFRIYLPIILKAWIAP